VAIKLLDKINGVRQGRAEGGITLVVSPLLALMKDQVDALKRLGISAEAMDSTKSREQYLDTVDAMREGNLDILYCAPERLNNEGFVASMASVKGGVRLLAVDEAHCISEWGHAFRPDYLKVARFAKEIQAERVVCLTATATPKVVEDVCKAFDIPPTEGVFRTPTYRDNLRLQARSFLTKEESWPELLTFLKHWQSAFGKLESTVDTTMLEWRRTRSPHARMRSCLPQTWSFVQQSRSVWASIKLTFAM
jgi:superfamily II DNA helicase RecQ